MVKNGMVRYIYIFKVCNITMQQLLIQDVYVKKIKSPRIRSSAETILCCVCKKGLKDGLQVTARTSSHGHCMFFCDIHY